MSEVTEKEILEARKKLAEKFGNTQIGGKGTQRRKHEAKKRGNKVETDKKIEAIAKKAQSKKDFKSRCCFLCLKKCLPDLSPQIFFCAVL